MNGEGLIQVWISRLSRRKFAAEDERESAQLSYHPLQKEPAASFCLYGEQCAPVGDCKSPVRSRLDQAAPCQP